MENKGAEPMSEAETVKLRERVRERLRAIFSENMYEGQYEPDPIIDAILREFRLQPVAWGRVTEGGEVEGL
jgi:hypothetical protein